MVDMFPSRFYGLNLFVRFVFLGSQLLVNFLIFHLLLVVYGANVFIALAVFFWLMYSFVDVVEREFRFQKYEYRLFKEGWSKKK